MQSVFLLCRDTTLLDGSKICILPTMRCAYSIRKNNYRFPFGCYCGVFSKCSNRHGASNIPEHERRHPSFRGGIFGVASGALFGALLGVWSGTKSSAFGVTNCGNHCAMQPITIS
jgi:hypothetical protein